MKRYRRDFLWVRSRLHRMRDLVYQMRKLCRNAKDGSFETCKKREEILMLAANQLSGELGYIHMKVNSLKPKHVEALVNHWKSQDLSIATLKARMSFVRWWSQKINKPNVVARSNEHYGIGKRTYLTDESKAIDVSADKINEIDDKYVNASLRLVKAFGLRKEEAIKIIPKTADRGDKLFLKASWCKGGREREVPILNDEQREALEIAKDVAGFRSLIPQELKYYQQRNRYEAITGSVGLKRLHGLRHRYAQDRYRELTGWDCPHQGGAKRKELSSHEKKIDHEARMTISRELGHNRIEIVANYIG